MVKNLLVVKIISLLDLDGGVCRLIDRTHNPTCRPTCTNSQGRDFGCVDGGVKLFITAVMATLPSVFVSRNDSRQTSNAYSSFSVCDGRG